MKTNYRTYTETIDGKLYGVVNLPLEGGGYKKKRKRVPNKTIARQWAQDQLASVPRTGADMTFRDLAVWYRDEHLVPPVYSNGKKLYGLRTWQSVRRQAENLAETFGDFLLDEITVDVLAKYKRKQLSGVSITSTNRRFALLRTMFKKAKQRKWMVENPFDVDPSLIEVALENKRQSGLTDRTVKRLLARSRKSSQPLLHYVLLTLAHTGARPSEVYPYEANDKSVVCEPLTWERVLTHDYKFVELVSYKGRVRQTRMVPTSFELEKGLRELHDRLGDAYSDLVFPVTTFKRSWKTLCTSVGVSGVRMRDFRHYFNSYLVGRSDINDMERMLILGHTKMETNARYSKLDTGIVERFRK
jgi:integrase